MLTRPKVIMLHSQLLFIICVFTLPHNDYAASLDCLLDPIEEIILFLDLEHQITARFINRVFNQRINRSHSASIKAAQSLCIYIESLWISQHDPKAQRELRKRYLEQYKKVRNNEMFLKIWPRFLAQTPIAHNLSSYNLSILDMHHTLDTQHKNISSARNLGSAVKTLIVCSQILFDSCFMSKLCGISEYRSFYAFAFESTWYYLTHYSSLRSRLPLLYHVPFLSINPDLVEPKLVENLDRLNIEHGLVIWSPHHIANYSKTRWTVDRLSFYMDRYLELYHWEKNTRIKKQSENPLDAKNYNDTLDADFRWYLRAALIIRVIDDRDFGDLRNALRSDFDNFMAMCVRTVGYLDVRHSDGILHRLLDALRKSNFQHYLTP